jgi:hypothetical protein
MWAHTWGCHAQQLDFNLKLASLVGQRWKEKNDMSLWVCVCLIKNVKLKLFDVGLPFYLSWSDFQVFMKLEFCSYGVFKLSDEDKLKFGLELENRYKITWNQLETKLSTILGTCKGSKFLHLGPPNLRATHFLHMFLWAAIIKTYHNNYGQFCNFFWTMQICEPTIWFVQI